MDEPSDLEQYDRHGFDAPLVSVGPVPFTYHEQRLKVILPRRSNHPDQEKWAFQGEDIDPLSDKNLEHTVARKPKEKKGRVLHVSSNCVPAMMPGAGTGGP